ncbi:hypothetical protein [Hydrogenophaga sp.]|uniref:hypothetical protein n=1 Tax=Hydrogenophaga sp. TaxID=1904254 RepID=UPI00271C2895|nr:hypothetical protein [Hydrogenophaga sp.]MDO9435033.1 hypothetical protein [Hydrogenophaga sp.]
MHHNAPIGKRALDNPETGLPPAQALHLEPQTPEEILEHLVALVVRTPMDHVIHLLEVLADGTVCKKYAGNERVHAFTLMLRYGDFELFVESFNLFGKRFEDAGPEPGHAPYKSNLSLSMPMSWNPPLAQLEATLSQVRVERLTVLPEPGTLHVPSAVSLCVSTLLNGGTTELIISGILQEPDVIASAIATSSLRWIAFPEISGWLCDKDVEGYQMVMEALQHCLTLKHLSIGQIELLGMHQIVGSFQKNGGPQLLAVGVGMTCQSDQITIDFDVPHNSDHLLAFMNMLGNIPTLSVCRLRGVQVEDTDSLQKYILAPLSRSRSLTHLDAQCAIAQATTQARMLAAPHLLALKTQCPSLTTLRCDLGEPRLDEDRAPAEAGRAIDQHLESGGSLTNALALHNMKTAVSGPHFNPRSIAFHGMHLSPEVCQVLFSALAHNRSLMHLDLKDCFIDLRSTAALVAALENNDTVEFVRLPLNLENYYVLIDGDQGTVAIGFPMFWSFQLASSSPPPLPLFFPRNLPPAYIEKANAAIPELTQLAAALFRTLIDKPVENRRNALLKVAYPHLMGPVQAFMSTALRSAPLYEPMADLPDAPAAFSIAAQQVVEQLSRDETLKWAVKLAAINHATDVHGLRTQGTNPTPPREVQMLVNEYDEHTAYEMDDRQKKAYRDVNQRVDFSIEAPVAEQPSIPKAAGPRDVQLRTHLNVAQWDLYVAMHTAIQMGDRGALLRAIWASGPVNVIDAWPRNELLALAAFSGNADIVSVLLESGAKDFGGYALMIARTPETIALLKPPVTGLTTTNTTETTTTAEATATLPPLPNARVADHSDDSIIHTMLWDPEDDLDNWL